jgi:hypothetical protein
MCLTNDAGHLGSATTSVSYLAPPSVSSVSPAVGPLSPGTQVTITGSNFTSDATIAVDGASASNVVVNSSTSISATLPSPPPGGAGTYDVIVTEADGTSPSNPPGDTFTYEPPPSVVGVSPSAGPLTSGTPITITGSNFTSDATVSVDGASASSVVVNSSTSISATLPSTPPDGAGTYDVIVTEADGASQRNSGDLFTYEASPSVTGVNPPVGGPAAGGNTVTISGANFYQDPSLSVSFGGTPGTDAIVTNTNTLTVVAPAGTALSTVEVQVTDAGGTSPLAPPGDEYIYGT